jgi:hypothetical protein
LISPGGWFDGGVFRSLDIALETGRIKNKRSQGAEDCHTNNSDASHKVFIFLNRTYTLLVDYCKPKDKPVWLALWLPMGGVFPLADLDFGSGSPGVGSVVTVPPRKDYLHRVFQPGGRFQQKTTVSTTMAVVLGGRSSRGGLQPG